MIPDLANTPFRVAIISRSARQRGSLVEILEHNGLQVVADEIIRERLAGSLDREIADVLLVDLDDRDDLDEDMLDVLVEQTSLPILFNDAAATQMQATLGGRAWGRRLAGKLIELAQESGVDDQAATATGEHVQGQAGTVSGAEAAPDLQLVEAVQETEPAGQPVGVEAETEAPSPEVAGVADEVYEAFDFTAGDTDGDELFFDLHAAIGEAVAEPESSPTQAAPADAGVARQVWVLGASIGGPQSVKEFLAALPPDPPVAFVLAQHIGVGFVDLLAEQLARVTSLQVSGVHEGAVLRRGQLVVTPVEKRVDFDDQGRVELHPVAPRSVYSPSIDAVMGAVANHYGAGSGAIVFSGMGCDGLEGCTAIAEKGGLVWAQSEETCVISSMADAVRNAGLVARSGSPAELAGELVRHLMEECDVDG